MKTIQELTNIANNRIEARVVDAQTDEAKAAYIQKVINDDALVYLTETDWYIIRAQETAVAAPADVLTSRAEARARIVR